MKKKAKKGGFTPAEGTRKDRAYYAEKLAIDPDDLDTCLINNPELIYHVHEQAVLAKDRHDTLKQELEVAEAEEDNKVRALAERNEEKVTEPFVKKQVQAAQTIVDLNDDLLKAKKEVGLWEALKEGFKQRSYVLSSLVDLNINRSPSGKGSSTLDRIAQRNYDRANEERERRRGK